MSIESKIPDATHDAIAAEFGRAANYLFEVEGFSATEILAVFHAEALAKMAHIFGVAFTLEVTERAVGRLKYGQANPVITTDTADGAGWLQ